MYYGCMVNVQIRDVPERVRDTLAEVARSRNQSTQGYLRELLEEDARRAGNVALLRGVRAVGGGSVSSPGETADEIDALRRERDPRRADEG